MEYKCNSCREPIVRPPSYFKNKSGHYYCNRSCAAKVNNKLVIKRPRSKKCKICKTLIRSGFLYCSACYRNTHYLQDKTLAEAIKNRRDANRYTGIRGNARKIYESFDRPKYCFVCGYDKHIHICHIKDIANFPLNTLISVINDIDNLIGLCPNHHWELDHGHLSVGQTGFAPVTNGL